MRFNCLGGQGSDCGRIVIWNMEPIRHTNQKNKSTLVT